MVPQHWGCTLRLWHLDECAEEDIGRAEDNRLPALRSLVVPHRPGGVATGHLGLGEQWLGKTCGRKEGEEHLVEENRHKTVGCLIYEGGGVSF